MGYPNGSCPKADGTTLSCGDYAVTVNPQLHVPQYPIPLPEGVFLKLRGGQRFTKLDLKIMWRVYKMTFLLLARMTMNTLRS